jgi:site-specific DNA recombinase
MDKAIIYCRVSTEEQAKEGHHSMATQESQCRKMASNYEIVKVFTDPGISGGKFEGRPGLQAMLKYVKKHSTKALFIQHTDRLARKVKLHHKILDKLRESNTDLYSVSFGKIEDTPEGKMSDGMMAVVNEYHRNITSYKTLQAMLNKAKSGWFPGEAPLGYKNVGRGTEDKIRVIELDPIVSPFIKLAFRKFATGNYSVEKLSDILHSKGFRSKRGFKISKSKMNYILKNLFYVGELHWSNVHLKKAAHKPIVSRQLYKQVQNIFTIHNHHACRRRKYSFLLRGFLYCTCDTRMTAGKFKNKKWDYYFCQNRKNCNESYIAVDKLEKQAEKQLKKIQFSDNFINIVIDKVKYGYKEMQKFNKVQKQSLINKKTSLEAKRDVAENKLLEGALDNKNFSRIRDTIQNQLDDVENQLLEASYQRELKIDEIQEVLSFTKNIHVAYTKASKDLKKQYLGLFFEKFIVKDQKIKKPILTPLFDNLVKAEKAYYKTQKPSQKEKVYMTSFIPYSNHRVKIRNEWGD